MFLWIKKHWHLILTVFVSLGFMIYGYGCESKVSSLNRIGVRINRQELQLELDQIITMAQIRLADLDQQEAFRAIVLQNALILVQGNPLNPVGIISAVAAVYGIAQGGRNITRVVKDTRNKRKANNA